MERFKKNDPVSQKAADMNDRAQIDPNKVREKQTGEATRKPATRMVTAAFRR